MNILERILLRKLEELFGDDASIVSNWIRGLGGNRPVVVVGAGFSRNAKGGENVPLWQHVTQQLERSAGIEPGYYTDPLTLAEYAWEEDENTFIRTLRSMMPDRDLEAQRAHKALFSYPVEAVITTNQLDTLLDQQSVWHRVVHDHDLALAEDDRPPLIYFHGHRDAVDTWIFTRSQYERLPQERPVLHAKVRQLLAQHPALILGYSLSDPDFHSVYRQVAEDMGKFQPRGLALVVSMPPAAEQRHWEKLGLRIVQIQPREDGYDSVFGRFLDLPPRLHEPFATLQEFRDELCNEPNLVERVELLAQYLEDPERRRLLDFSTWDLLELWKAAISPEFDAETWKELTTKSADESKRLAQREFHVVPSTRFPSRSPHHYRYVRIVDRLLGTTSYDRDPQALATIGRWLSVAIDLLVSADNHSSEFSLREMVGLACWVWAKAGTTALRGTNEVPKPVAREAGRRIQKYFEIADRYDYIGYAEDEEKKELDFGADFSALGISMPAAGPVLDAFRQLMTDAAAAALDRDYSAAAEFYAQAHSTVAGAAPFREWLAVAGLHSALVNHRWRSQDAEATTTTLEIERAKESLDRAETKAQVREWKERAERRLTALDRLVITELRENQRALTSGTVLRFDNTRYYAWRSFRDLESEVAPPTLLLRYLTPILEAGGLDDGTVLRYRLRLGVESTNTKHWLRDRLHSPEPSGEERERRDEEFVRIFLDTKEVGASELEGRLEQFPQISTIFRAEDLEGSAALLSEFRSRAEHHPGYLDGLTAAISAYVCQAPFAEASKAALHYVEKVESGFEWAQWAKRLHSWPWYRWGHAQPTESETLLRTLADSAQEGLSTSDRHDAIVWAMLKWVEAAGSDRISGQLRRQVVEILNGEASPTGTSSWDSDEVRRRLALRAMIGSEADLQSALEGAVSSCEDRLRSARKSGESRESLYAILWVGGYLTEIIGRSCSLLEVANEWLSDYDGQYKQILQWVQHNEHLESAGVLARAVGTILPFVEEARRPKLVGMLVELMRLDPRTISKIPRDALSPEIWGATWRELVDIVVRYAAGNWADDGGQLRVQLLDTFFALHRRPRSSDDRPHEDLVRPLLELPYLFAADHRAPLAAVAVRGLCLFASTPAGLADPRIHSLLTSAAADPRVLVRRTAAYGIARLQKMVEDPDLRTLATRLDQQLSGDPYLGVINSREVGRAEPAYFTGDMTLHP